MVEATAEGEKEMRSYYYAGFDEYQNILPATIRTTKKEAFAAICKKFKIKKLKDGLCIGKIKGISYGKVEWVQGWRKK